MSIFNLEPQKIEVTEDDLIDHAKDEAEDIASCLWKYRQIHPSCDECNFVDFCSELKEWLDNEIRDSEESAEVE